jgi:enoyl-CoA hydratase/carnithine racemase
VSEDTVLYETAGPVARITMNRPERLNAVDPAQSRQILEAFERFKADDSLRVAILTGTGKAFCVGDDLKEMDSTADEQGVAADHGDVAFGGITADFECWKPIIAAVNGYCVGGGLEIALSCDIRIASEAASFGLPEPRWSLIPSAGGTQRLPRMIPRAFAMELLLTGGRVDAATALRWGIVSRVVPPEELLPEAERLAGQVAACGPLALEGIKEIVAKSIQMPVAEAMRWERDIARRALGSHDAREGVRAFVEKRAPNFERR